MVEADKKKFSELLRDMYAMHGKELTAGMVKVWLTQLGVYSIEAIEGAFNAYWRSAQRPPLPADILKFLPDPFGHLGAEEAWNRAPKSERDCGYVTNQIMAALDAASDSIARGDMIGARMAFVEAYRSEVSKAQAQGLVAVYWYTEAHGISRERRLAQKERHTIEAAERKWVDPQKALNLLSVICSEQGKPSEQYVARLQSLSATPLRLTNTSSAKPNLRLVNEGMRIISEGNPLTPEQVQEKLNGLRKLLDGEAKSQ